MGTEKIVEGGVREVNRAGFHGHAKRGEKSPTWRSWRQMRRRCHDERNKDYPAYGGRGITVCARWQSFPAFLADMGERPTALHTLDRLDNAKGYEPGNVRWATRQQQTRNRKSCRRIEFEGLSLPLVEWVELLGLDYTLVQRRISRGWIPELAFTLPPIDPRRPALPQRSSTESGTESSLGGNGEGRCDLAGSLTSPAEPLDRDYGSPRVFALGG